MRGQMGEIGMQFLPEVLDKFPDRIPHIGHQGITGILHVNLELYLWERGAWVGETSGRDEFKLAHRIGPFGENENVGTLHSTNKIRKTNNQLPVPGSQSVAPRGWKRSAIIETVGA